MATRERAEDAGRRRARRLVAEICREFHEARSAAGLSQAALARAAGLSQSSYSRLERGARADVGTATLACVGAALGLDVVLRAYPVGAPVRDVAHIRLTERFQADVHPSLRWQAEVPIPIAGDRRAWDGSLSDSTDWVAVEVETRLRDVQALQRRIALKARDGGVDRIILVVADTRADRLALAAAGDALRPQFPLSTRAVMTALRVGRLPAASGIVVI